MPSRKTHKKQRGGNDINVDLLKAVKDNDYDAVKKILSPGVFSAAFYKKKADPTKKVGDISPLLYALKNLKDKMVDLLLNNSKQIDNTLENGKSPLHIAIDAGQLDDVIDKLIKLGADPNIKSKDGLTPLHLSIQKGEHLITLSLLKEGADPNIKTNDGETALYLLVKEYNKKGWGKEIYIDLIKEALKRGGDPNIQAKNGDTPLKYALIYLPGNIIELLLKKSKHLDTTLFENGKTLLHIAVELGHMYNVIDKLIGLGVDPNIKSKDGLTPLHLAIKRDKPFSGLTLLDKGVDPNIKTDDGETALYLAVEEGIKRSDYLTYKRLIEKLLKKGCNPNITNKNGDTPLYFAATKGNLSFVTLLLDNNVLLDEKTRNAINTFKPVIVDVLNKALKDIVTSDKLWKGWSAADAEKFDTIFTEEGAYNLACCPICLKVVERKDACMYMSHRCTALKGYYSKKLYNLFHNNATEGMVYWCTICGRQCLGHKHYQLSDYNNPVKVFMKDNDGRVISGDPFDKDCSIRNGGGGLPENIARFRRIREAALELNKEVGKISKRDALERLIEANWNVHIKPANSKVIDKIIETKKWNIPHGEFKEGKPQSKGVEKVLKDIVRPEPNASDPKLQPIVHEKGDNTFMGDTDVEVIQFRHRQEDGTINNHEDDRITPENLTAILTETVGNTIHPKFGYCYMYPYCKALLYPSEVKKFIPDALYDKYKMEFNKKFKETTGGGRDSIEESGFGAEATNAKCVVIAPPSLKGSQSANKTRRHSGSKRGTSPVNKSRKQRG